MAWTAKDAEQFKKGLSQKQKRKWAVVANSAFTACQESGGKDCENRAVKIANTKFEKEVLFNPVIDADMADKVKAFLKLTEAQAIVDSQGEVEMEIFRAGVHNGDEFTEDDLQEIVDNFHKLKGDLRPKLKITHRENQESLAGLSSYGDVIDAFIKKVEDGTKRLYAKIASVPKEIIALIKDRRFPERSIELYPEFKLGTKKDSPLYRNVLKAIALLGHEMPAVSGMAPIMLEECLECQGTMCFIESTTEKVETLEVPDDIANEVQIREFEMRLYSANNP